MINKSASVKNKAPVFLVTGKNGQLGWEMKRTLMPLGHVVSFDFDEMDLTDADAIKKVIQQVKPDVIVNTAAYTAVDKAEEESDIVMQINGLAPGILAEEAKRIGALLIHYSTDYVFNGEKQSPYLETDETQPINVYGVTKLAGEKNIQDSGADFVILRTSWVYSHRAHNFLLSILKLAREREELNIVSDQVGAPTSARFIAEVSSHVISQSLFNRREDSFESGLYHLVCSGEASWFDFASEIVKKARSLPDAELKIKQIRPIPTSGYPTPAKRPANSRLSTDKISEHFDLQMIDWKQCLNYCFEDIC